MKLCLCLFYTALHVIIGCNISEPELETITRSPGESVLLHCSCTDLKCKPDDIQWMFGRPNSKDHYNLIGQQSEEESYSGRVQTFNENTPGNASLLLSNLTEEDQGEYQCMVESNGSGKSRVITLIIKISADCFISEPENETIIRSPGESVLLSCSCTDLQIKPDVFTWSSISTTRYSNVIGELSEEEKKAYSSRVQTFNASSPGNASLLLSNLTEEDQGDYICEIMYKQNRKERTITLKIKVQEVEEVVFSGEGEGTGAVTPPHSMSMVITTTILLGVVLLGTAAVIYRRKRKKRNGSSENREEHSGLEQNEDVTYSIIVHERTARAAPRESNTEETTQYSCIRTDRV